MPVLLVRPAQAVFEPVAAHFKNIPETLGVQLNLRRFAAQFFAQLGGIHQNARFLGLAHHLAQLHALDPRPEALGQQRGVEGRAQQLAHRRQLGRVADEQQPVSGFLEHEAHQIVEQPGFAEGFFVGYHRGLVHDVEHFLLPVGLALEAQALGGGAAGLAVDFFMNRAGRHPGVGAHYLGRPAGGRHQGVFALQAGQPLHERAHDGRFAGARVAAQHEYLAPRQLVAQKLIELPE